MENRQKQKIKLILRYLLINTNATIFYRTKNKKMCERISILSFARKYKKQLLDTGTDSLKNASQKVVHEAGGVLENKITDAVTKSNNDKIVKI